jgi:lipoate-protein ligase A
MAVDETLMPSARDGILTLRFYRWEPGCLSLGRNQPSGESIPPLPSRRPGVDVVRRPTGGRAVFHHRELTYSVAISDRAWGGPRETYARVNAALSRGIARFGIAVTAAADATVTHPAATHAPATTDPVMAPLAPGADRACFADSAPGELLAGGRKLVGSAQWRHEGVILQHGSILLHDDQSLAGQPGVAESRPATGAIGLADLLTEVPDEQALIVALESGFEEELGVMTERGERTADESRMARLLEGKYCSDEWTWRR